MSRQQAVSPIASPATPLDYAAPEAKPCGFVYHAKIISLLTLASRVLGVVRESLAAKYFGAGMVSSAFAIAFTIPNLFRRLFGEGALSAAFIPLYSQALKENDEGREARRFAAATVNLLFLILLAITIVGEVLLLGHIAVRNMADDRRLAIRLTMVMLPYVMFVCGAAFLGAILQVHKRFGMTAAAPIVLNVALIGGTVAGAWIYGTRTVDGQVRAIYFLSAFVLVAGLLQVLMLLPSLRAVGFRFDFTILWTPTVRKMLAISVPVAIGGGILQISTLLDRVISFVLAESTSSDTFTLLGRTIRYPMEFGAAARLAWAQYLYQFPLGVFAIAIATAIFPALSADALEKDQEKFRAGLRRGIQVTLWEALPASLGLMFVAHAATQVLFERGAFNANDSLLVARSVRVYSMAIWAFSLQQIINRAYYALHDAWTPLWVSLGTVLVNLAVELPLIWVMGEAGMAAGTSVSFGLQAVVMLWMLSRRTGGLGLRSLAPYVVKLCVATAAMGAALWLLRKTPLYPADLSRATALWRLVVQLGVGAGVYLLMCAILRVMPKLR